MESFFDKVKEKVKEGVEDLFDGEKDEKHENNSHDNQKHSHDNVQAKAEGKVNTNNRYSSFAPQSSGNAKWYVDGASYFWAVSIALEGNIPPKPLFF
jgi:phospholipase D1/2